LPDLSEFEFTSRVRPIVQVGIGNMPIQVGTALWDTAIWDVDTWVGADEPALLGYGQWDVARWDNVASQAFWSGWEPEWFDITCETISVELQTGRARTTDHFDVGSASVVLDNADGRFDLHLPAVPGAEQTMIPGRPLRVGVQHVDEGVLWLWRGYIDEVIPNYQPVEHDVVVVNAIDALGEVSRGDIQRFDPPIGTNDTCTQRIRRILDLTGWPRAGQTLDPAATIMLPTEGGGAVSDLMAVTVESEGGAIYGDRLGRVRLRARDWQTYDATDPVDARVGNVDPDEVCPTEVETSFRRQDIVTRAVVKRTIDTRSRVYEDVEGIGRYGIETWRAEDLICALPDQLPILARRQLRVRNSDIVPRVEAVTFDAATGDDVIDLMCATDPLLPSRWQVRLRQERGDVINRQLFVTGVRHTIERDSWVMRCDLDLASPFAVPHEHRWEPTEETDTRWGTAQWQRAG